MRPDAPSITSRINFDGTLLYGLKHGGAVIDCYVQVFRSGIVEAVTWAQEQFLTAGQGQVGIGVLALSALVARFTQRYAHGLHSVGVSPPLAVLVSVLNTRGYEMRAAATNVAFSESFPITEDPLLCSPAVLQSVPAGEAEAAVMLKDVVLDPLANAAGVVGSPLFDKSGNYTHPFGVN